MSGLGEFPEAFGTSLAIWLQHEVLSLLPVVAPGPRHPYGVRRRDDHLLRGAVEVPPLVLLVSGLALLGLGASIRRWRAWAWTAEPERSDGLPLSPAFRSPLGSPVSDAAPTVPGSTNPSELSRRSHSSSPDAAGRS